MNFTFTWILDKLGYMPKIDMQVGKVNLKAQEVWPFPVEEPKPTAKKKPVKKTRPLPSRVTKTKQAVKKVK